MNEVPEQQFAAYPRPHMKGLNNQAKRLQALIDVYFYHPMSFVALPMFMFALRIPRPFLLSLGAIAAAIVAVDFYNCQTKLAVGLARNGNSIRGRAALLGLFLFLLFCWSRGPIVIVTLFLLTLGPIYYARNIAKRELKRLGINPVASPTPKQTAAWEEYVQSQNKEEIWTPPLP